MFLQISSFFSLYLNVNIIIILEVSKFSLRLSEDGGETSGTDSFRQANQRLDKARALVTW